MQPGVIDLAELKARNDALKRVEEQREAEEAIANAVAWNKAMKRAFKGIFPRPEAHRFLERSANA